MGDGIFTQKVLAALLDSLDLDRSLNRGFLNLFIVLKKFINIKKNGEFLSFSLYSWSSDHIQVLISYNERCVLKELQMKKVPDKFCNVKKRIESEIKTWFQIASHKKIVIKDF